MKFSAPSNIGVTDSKYIAVKFFEGVPDSLIGYYPTHTGICLACRSMYAYWNGKDDLHEKFEGYPSCNHSVAIRKMLFNLVTSWCLYQWIQSGAIDEPPIED